MPLPLALIPLLTAAGGAIGQHLLNNRAAKKSAQYTARANMDLARQGFEYDKSQADLAYQRQMEMWDKQNAYNSPEAQMARFSKAGLNPNLIYGQGSPGNTASSSPQYHAPRFSTPSTQYRFTPASIPDMLSMYQDFQLKKAQIENVQASTANTQQRTSNESLRSIILGVQGESSRFGLERSRGLYPSELERASQSIQKGALDLRRGEFDLSKQQSLLPYQTDALALQNKRSAAGLDLDLQKLRLMKKDEQLKVIEQHAKWLGLSAIQLENEKKQAEILFQQYRNQWMEMGVTTSDNALLRLFTRMLNEEGMAPSLNAAGQRQSMGRRIAKWMVGPPDSTRVPFNKD